jgi:hypothetical protein
MPLIRMYVENEQSTKNGDWDTDRKGNEDSIAGRTDGTRAEKFRKSSSGIAQAAFWYINTTPP